MAVQTIGLITYHVPHLKTEQVFQKIKDKPYSYKFYALPFKERKKRSPLFQHRPDQSTGQHPEQLAKAHSLPYKICTSDKDIDGTCDVYLILGAGILSPEAIEGKRVINGHPGIIPACRGLDAFKWAIYDGKPLGVTLHYIEKEVDAGEIICVVPTPVKATDTFESLATRHYENEINCMARFDDFLKQSKNDFKDIEAGDARMRMPNEIEKELQNRFSDYIKKYGLH